jgi:hypothetical protein
LPKSVRRNKETDIGVRLVPKNIDNSTAAQPQEADYKGDDNVHSGSEETVEYVVESQTVSSGQVKEEKAESTEEDKLLNLPLPSKTVLTVRGKTVTVWSIERRRIAKSFLEQWHKAVNCIDNEGFAVYVSGLAKEIDDQMPKFRNIPGEDVFAGILQLLQDIFSGKNFQLLQEKRIITPVEEILALLRKEEKLNLSIYQNIIGKLHDQGFLC